ncbi:hypothetical protein KUV85_16290 [Nocardioides panacisoli]|uniref:hypothetical protein n=1 Tax=Nocardioides panacisoli TaxID=627624 RepID=UPI001C62E11F|nr:hypothetical protein [Nocardioides panacisoli]QYJ03860.1 hypothetical protein KUV85_16290 [Nocardioides panacisoli]
MRTSLRLAGAMAAAALPLAMFPAAAQADHANGEYSSRLDPQNGSGGSGMVTVSIDGDQATVNLNYDGLAEQFDGGPFPHVQHIHIGGQGTCPTPADDENGDGVVSTPEGQASYGGIGTTLSTKGSTGPEEGTNIQLAPGGGSADYSRTFTMNDDTLDALANGSGVVVVHGLDPSTLSQEAQNAKSPLVPELPLAATAPALCGSIATMPSGGVATGSGSTSGMEDLGLLGGGAALVLGGGALYAANRRFRTDAVEAR